ncbi:MAG: dephospho-CoA kinase [Prevotella sp.]|nr:dephospho-CoA kinase [Prevotella sp.]
MKYGITGGIGSGKSYVCSRLARHGIEVYDCDAAAKRLIRTSPEIYQQLTRLIGPEAYEQPAATATSEPPFFRLNKAVVAQFLLQSEANAHAIDAIVHPAVFRDFEESGMLWMESAILFESGINRLVDRVIVVTAPEEVRIRRVMQRDGISREKVVEWMQRQWPQSEVRARADFEIINDGIADIDRQLQQLQLV